MNLLSDLSNELALAILIEKKHSEKFNSKEAPNLIGRVQKILQPLQNEKKIAKPPLPDSKAANI